MIRSSRLFNNNEEVARTNKSKEPSRLDPQDSTNHGRLHGQKKLRSPQDQMPRDCPHQTSQNLSCKHMQTRSTRTNSVNVRRIRKTCAKDKPYTYAKASQCVQNMYTNLRKIRIRRQNTYTNVQKSRKTYANPHTFAKIVCSSFLQSNN